MRGKAPKIFSYYGPGGWTPERKRTLEAIVLPEKTRCFVCEKMKKTTVMFSEKQLNDLRNGLASSQIKANEALKGWITCRVCTGVQNSEMQCIICEKIKGLDGFAKTQRRDPDNARCTTCIALAANDLPIEKAADRDDDVDSDDEFRSDDGRSNIYGSSIHASDDLTSGSGVLLPDDLTTENLDHLNVSTANTPQPSASKASTTASLVGTGKAPSPASAAGVTAWQAISRGKGKENLNTRHFTAYDAQGRAHRKLISTSSTGSEDSDATTVNADVVDNYPESKFAKVPAGHRTVPVPDYDGGRNVSYDNDSDEDADDDFFTI